jgi:hypothetical protein
VPRSANVILLGAAQKALGIENDKLEEAIRRVFGRKGDEVVEANIKALAIGETHRNKFHRRCRTGNTAATPIRVHKRIHETNSNQPGID